MARSTSVISSETKKKVRVYSNGPMAGNTMVAGKMANNMARAYTQTLQEKPKLASGLKARDCTG